jgi:hypothetical protein
MTSSIKKKLLIAAALSVLMLAASVPAAIAKPNEFDTIVRHLETKYQAKKVHVPFMWLARFAVAVVHPAGVKSFKVTLFENLKFSRDTLDEEMQEVMRDAFSPDWVPILRVRSRDGQQVYMNMREAGSNVKITMVTIDKDQAAVIRATFNPDKLVDFLDNPKIFGISLGDRESASDTPETPKKEPAEENKEEN